LIGGIDHGGGIIHTRADVRQIRNVCCIFWRDDLRRVSAVWIGLWRFFARQAPGITVARGWRR
jgi:hypothetical protein